ncbi:MAG: ATP-dependent zinc metalloprotease FtsH [Planctomycetaceae bacterium]|jgi:cell division protease FtsH|nr:ATP-dependent zinc metalloprotease FtsH [Planctomycetaceae bacterium]
MADDNKSDKRSNPQGNGQPGSNWLMYALLGMLLLMAAFSFVSTALYQEIRYPDLVELIDATKYNDSSQTTFAEGSEGKKIITVNNEKYELSRLRNVQVDKDTVRGEITVSKIVDGKPATPKNRIFQSVKDNSENTNKELKDKLTASKISWDNAPGQSMLTQFFWMFLLPFFLISTLLYFFMRRMGGIGSPMQFGRSRGKLYAQEDIGITFNDVAGIDEAVEEVREIVDFLKHPEKYQRLGGRIPRGVLLVGPPGTGKTLLAKAIAGEAGVPFFSLSGSDFVEMFVGVGAARVRDMFQQAVAKSPCIIFIDELDALGKSRAGNIVGSHDEREQTLNALLVEMDGFDPNSGVIVMAATNRPETLDPALLRAGRFDRHVLVDRPDKQGREDILKVHVKNVKLSSNVELTHIAAITPGFVGADLANLVNEAALLAARKGKNVVDQDELNEAVERAAAGLEKKKRVMNEDEKLRVAYHEAGHALVAYSIPNTDPVHKVSIIPRGVAALGYTMQRPEDDRYLVTQPELEAQMQVLLAGTLTEEMVFRDISTGASNDLERATNIARAMVMQYGMSRLGRVNFREGNRSAFLATGGGESFGRDYSEQTAREIDQEVKRLIDESAAHARTILTERRSALEALANRLMEVEVVDGQDLKKIVDATIDGPRVVPGTVPNPAANSMSGNASTLSDQVPKATGGPGMVAEQ